MCLFKRINLELTRNRAQVVNLLRALQSYLPANPDQQNTTNGVTAAAAGTLVRALAAAA